VVAPTVPPSLERVYDVVVNGTSRSGVSSPDKFFVQPVCVQMASQYTALLLEHAGQ